MHRLRPNEVVWTPASVVFLDTETQWREEGRSELHTMRLWVACHVDRRHVRKTQGPIRWGFGETPDELAAFLTERARGRDSLWVYAHNLNFDLVVSMLPQTMTAAGWAVTDFSVSQGAPWLRLKRDDHVITVVDSWAWLPQSLESMATMMGRHKFELPDNEGPVHAWITRCATDVELLARAVLGLMEWWDREELGRWTISGAGSGWNAMRHVGSELRHVIDPEPELVAQDRLAVRGGRKDAAVVRAETGGPFVELDLVAAYPTVARELPLPVKRAFTFTELPTDSKWISSRFYGPVAEATITCDRPRYPVRHGGVTWFPVGTFTTTLAGPELEWARANGDLVAIGAGQMHKLGLALRPWATWVLDPSKGGQVEVPPVAKVATKVWGRSVLGKFAARSHSSELLEGWVPDGWGVTDLWDRRVARKGAEVSMAGQRWLITYDQDTENCYPAVLAWVESEVRVRLGRVLEELDGAWWTADTDGLLVDLYRPHAWYQMLKGGPRFREMTPDLAAQALCDHLAELVAPLTLRPKKLYDTLAVIGPQHLVVGGERRLSGVRGEAREVEPNKFVARDWPKLKWQMANSTPGTYTRPERISTFTSPTVHRWVMSDGTTRPVEMRLGPDGANELVPWAECRWAGAGPGLAVAQYRLLERLAS